MRTTTQVYLTVQSKKLFGILLSSLVFVPLTWAQNEVNVYSYRNPELIQPMFDAFTDNSGISVNVVFAKKGVLEKLRSEGINSPADLVFTTDVGRLSDIKQAGLTQPVQSRSLDDNIPENLRDPLGHWYGLTSRARIIVVSKDRVEPNAVKTYEDLADLKFHGLICTRSGKHAYMISLIASMISHHGSEIAEQWLAGLQANLARRPEGNDRSQVKAIREGACDIAVINHYYMFQMLSDPEQKSWAQAVDVIFPNQNDRGTHMNVSGMAMAKHSPNRANALKLMEFLASEKVQKMYAKINGEFAVSPGISPADTVQEWGQFKQDDVNLTDVASNRAQASKMVDRVAYDN